MKMKGLKSETQYAIVISETDLHSEQTALTIS